MNIQNLTVSGPATGSNCPAADCGDAVLYGIYFDDASGNRRQRHSRPHLPVPEGRVRFLPDRTGDPGGRHHGARTVTITNTTVKDYQKSGFEPHRGSMTMDLSGSTAGPPHPLEGLMAQNGVSYVGAAGRVENNTIFGSGNTPTHGGDGKARPCCCPAPTMSP